MKYGLIVLLLIGALHADAQSGKKLRKRVPHPKPALSKSAWVPWTEFQKANTLRICSPMTDQPAWFLEVNREIQLPATMAKPLHYRIISTIDSTFDNYLHKIPFDRSQVMITLPVFLNQRLECKTFRVERVLTMDSALQAKYPALMSFRAFAPDNGLNSARINCDEQQVSIMITFEKRNYFIQSFQFQNRRYYCCYAQDDPNFIKASAGY